MSFQNSHPATTSQAQYGISAYILALNFADLGPIARKIVNLIYVHSVQIPRMVDGARKALGYEINITRLAEQLGSARQNVSASLRTLRAWKVLKRCADGGWTINLSYRDWIDEQGHPVLHPSFYPEIESLLTKAACATMRGGHDGACGGGMMAQTPPPEEAQPIEDIARRGGNSHSRAVEPGEALSIEELIDREDSYIYPKVNERITGTSSGGSLPSRGGAAGDESNPDAEADGPAVEGPGKATSEHIYTKNSDCSTGGNPDHPDISGPDRDVSATCIHTTMHGGDAAQNEPGCTQIDAPGRDVGSISPPRACAVAPLLRTPGTVQAESDAEFHARSSRFGASYPGTVVPDPAQIDTAHRLADLLFPLNDSIHSGIELYKFIYPSVWIVKAIKRAKLVKRRLGNFGYVESILKGWNYGGGTDAGPEDRFDDEMRPIQFRTAPVPDEPVLSDEEKRERIKAMLKKALPFSDVDSMFNREAS